MLDVWAHVWSGRSSPAQTFDPRWASSQTLQPESLYGVWTLGQLALGVHRHLSVVSRCARHPWHHTDQSGFTLTADLRLNSPTVHCVWLSDLSQIKYKMLYLKKTFKHHLLEVWQTSPKSCLDKVSSFEPPWPANQDAPENHIHGCFSIPVIIFTVYCVQDQTLDWGHHHTWPPISPVYRLRCVWTWGLWSDSLFW